MVIECKLQKIQFRYDFLDMSSKFKYKFNKGEI